MGGIDRAARVLTRELRQARIPAIERGLGDPDGLLIGIGHDDAAVDAGRRAAIEAGQGVHRAAARLQRLAVGGDALGRVPGRAERHVMIAVGARIARPVIIGRRIPHRRKRLL